MIKTVRFYKEDNKWYADIPNHTMEENEMVMGSDMMLDALSGGTNQIIIKLTDEEYENPYLHFHMKSHDDEGAYYDINGLIYEEYAPMLAELYPGFEHEIWICNVTHDVFGEHPEDIYVIGYQI